jgi:hypothetical protein
MVKKFITIWQSLATIFGLLVLAALVGLTGCHERQLDRFPIVQSFKQEKIRKIDILWVLDNSVSMDEENPLVQNGSSNFINALVGSNADFQLGVITMNVQSQTALGNPNSSILDQSGKLQAPANIPSILATSTQTATDIRNGFNIILNYIQTDPTESTNTLGKGCEAGLEAARLAVDPAINQNPGFIRDDGRSGVADSSV